MSIRNRKLSLLVVLSCSIFGVLAVMALLTYHQVGNSLTSEDVKYIKKFLGEADILSFSEQRGYEDERRFIIKVQKTVLRIAHNSNGIPFNMQREPKNIFLAKSGLCYDRSRVIEKILRYSDFQTRHISIYSTKETSSALKSLITPHVSSHAVTEVLTSRGWLVVDSNDPWVSLDEQGNPISINQIQSDVGTESISWKDDKFSSIYKVPFTFVYGLYSRHGRFYPPYNFIPDINYRELIHNFL